MTREGETADEGGGGAAFFDGVGGRLGDFVEEFEGGGSESDGSGLERLFGEGAVGLEVKTDGWGEGEGKEFLGGEMFGFGEFEEVEAEGEVDGEEVGFAVGEREMVGDVDHCVWNILGIVLAVNTQKTVFVWNFRFGWVGAIRKAEVA